MYRVTPARMGLTGVVLDKGTEPVAKDCTVSDFEAVKKLSRSLRVVKS
jgi:hypothetical protein